MQIKNYRKLLLLIICFNLFFNADIYAAMTCVATINNFAFGTFDPFAGSIKQTTSSVTVTCTYALLPLTSSTANYTLTLNTGSSGTYTARTMLSSAKTLAYNIYKDTPPTQILGNGTGSTFTITGSQSFLLPGSQTNNYTIYGKIPVQPLAKAGSYSETITATVSW